MPYWVAVYVEGPRTWVHVGPVFTCRDDAVRFLEHLRNPRKRVVQYAASGAETTAPPGHVDLLRHLEFARFLYRTGRLSEGIEQPTRGERTDMAA